MTLPYALRLLCLCFSFFFLLNALAALAVSAASAPAVRFAGKRSSVAAARLLLALRLLPCFSSVLFVFLLCVPSYLSLEPAATSEFVGLPCLILGILGCGTWLLAVLRTARAVSASLRHNRRVTALASHVYEGKNRGKIFVVEIASPLLALSGVFRPRLLISRALLGALSPEQLDAALAHEQAHRLSRDNFKRLLLLLTPDFFPFVNVFHRLEQHWCTFTEWAADDHAAAGDSQRALSLAAALVRTARLGSSQALPYLATSLLACDRDLDARVHRLLHSAEVARASRPHPLLRAATCLLAISFAALLFAPFTISLVHELQELLLH